MIKPALYWKKYGSDIQCVLCPKNCIIKNSKKGFCRARINEKNSLYSIIYAECSAMALDPIEKKPLYHFFPGTNIFSIGTLGCNLGCKFCQNWHISQSIADTKQVMPDEVIKLAKKSNSIGIAYTYNEPIIWYEYVLDTAKLAKENGLKNVLVTNGFISEEPLKELLAYIDAMNIDLKSIKNEFYKNVCFGELEPVKNTIKIASKHTHIEITNLLITGLNDTKEEIEELVDFIAKINPEIPLHFSRYFPQYKMNINSTSEETLIKAKQIADKKLKYVYLGNVGITDGSNTLCPRDREEVLIERVGYLIKKNNIENGKCKFCSVPIKGVFQ